MNRYIDQSPIAEAKAKKNKAEMEGMERAQVLLLPMSKTSFLLRYKLFNSYCFSFTKGFYYPASWRSAISKQNLITAEILQGRLT